MYHGGKFQHKDEQSRPAGDDLQRAQEQEQLP